MAATTEIEWRLETLCRLLLRPPYSYTRDETGPVFTFDPPLTTEEQVTFNRLREAAVSAVSLTPEEWDAIRPDLQALRDLRQLGRNAFMALAATDRDRALYDAQTSTTKILLALLRS